MQKISIIIPAYNEEQRIGKTLDAYAQFFLQKKQETKLDFEILVVLNGCKDNTKDVVNNAILHWGSQIRCIESKEAGKGLAVIAGFLDALKRNNTMIGFVDADMATRPEYFYELVPQLAAYDGAILSRYAPGAKLFPPRPKYKRWGSIIIYESMVKLLFGMSYYDYQCGAKLFRRHVIETIVPSMQLKQWAFDVELLYLCKKHDFNIIEIPTVWYDQEGSKLNPLTSGMRMLGALIYLRFMYSPCKRFLK